MEGNLSSYRIFHSVARHGNISYAAKELYISQPAISKAIRKLEDNLGVRLFYRSSRGVTLTPEGEALYAQTSRAFEALEEGEADVRRMKQLGIGQLRIGASTTLCKYVLLPYLKEFVEQYPHIKILISCQSTFRTMDLLEEGKLDIGLIGKSGYGKDLEFYGIQWIEDIFVVGRKYYENLKIRNQEKAPDIFREGNLMLLDEENISRHYIDDYFRQQGIAANQVLEVGSMDLLIEFAKIGLGAACVIKEFVREELQKGILMELPLEHRIEKREIGFALQKKHTTAKPVEKFLKHIRFPITG